MSEPTWYVTEEELKATLELTGMQFADNDVRAAIAAASRGIDAATGRRFYKDTVDVARYYTPELTDILPIDDLVTATTVKSDSTGAGSYTTTWTVNQDYTLAPINAQADGRPYTCLKVHPTQGRYPFPIGVPRAIQITGVFGWPAVPANVKELATIVAAKLMRRAREAPFGVVSAGIEVGVAMRIARSDPDAAFLLEDVSRNEVALA